VPPQHGGAVEEEGGVVGEAGGVVASRRAVGRRVQPPLVERVEADDLVHEQAELRPLRAEHEEVARDILRVQRDLFVAGAELATAPEAGDRLADGVSRINAEMVDALDTLIDGYMDRVSLPPKFVIPGGTQLSAQLDVARSVIRRAERRAVALRDEQGLADDAVLRYLNRASDLIYAMARFTDVEEPEIFEGRG